MPKSIKESSTMFYYEKQERKNIFFMNKEVGMLLQKRADTSGVGIGNYEEIYIPPYNIH